MSLSGKVRANFAGVLLLVGISVLSLYASKVVTVAGKHPIEASALCVIVGIAIAQFGLHSVFKEGVSLAERFLIWGVVLMGATLDFRAFASDGAKFLGVILITMLVGFFATYLLAKSMRLAPGLALLLTVGTTICGGSAIAVTAPLIQAKQEETSYAITTITFWGLIALLLYPPIARLCGASDIAFGVFAGSAIHSTPQVVGAGFIYSELAGKVATAVKLIRNCFMAPVAFIIAFLYVRTVKKVNERALLKKAFPWFLFGFFVMALLRSLDIISSSSEAHFSEVGRFLILLGMAGVGLLTDFRAFRAAGLKPLVVGFLGATIVAAISIASIIVLI